MAVVEPAESHGHVTYEGNGCIRKSYPLLGAFKCKIKLGYKERTETCFVTPLDLNLFGIPWIDAFDLWEVPASAICNQVKAANMKSKVATEVKGISKIKEEEGSALGNKGQERSSCYEESKEVKRSQRKSKEEKVRINSIHDDGVWYNENKNTWEQSVEEQTVDQQNTGQQQSARNVSHISEVAEFQLHQAYGWQHPLCRGFVRF